jgi:hypothetical protein
VPPGSVQTPPAAPSTSTAPPTAAARNPQEGAPVPPGSVQTPPAAPSTSIAPPTAAARNPQEAGPVPTGSVQTRPPATATTSVAPRDLSGPTRSAEEAIQTASTERQRIDALADWSVLRALDPNVARADAAARRALDEATQKLGSGRGGDVAALRDAVNLAQVAFRGFEEARALAAEAVRRLTAELVSVTTPYFSGDYAAAKTALDRLKYPPSRFAAQVRLFQAATAYALYVLDGERDQALRAVAEAQARECRRIAANINPDPRVFSPKFIQFFRTAR